MRRLRAGEPARLLRVRTRLARTLERSARIPALWPEPALRRVPARSVSVLRPVLVLLRVPARSVPVLWPVSVLRRVPARSVSVLRSVPALLRGTALLPEAPLGALTRRRSVPALRRGGVLRIAGRPEPGLLRRRVPALLAEAAAGRVAARRPEPVRTVPGLRDGARLGGVPGLRKRPWLRGRPRPRGETWWRAKARLRIEAGLCVEAALRLVAASSLTAVPAAGLGRGVASLVTGGTLPGIAALLPLRNTDGVARGVEARRAALTAGLLSLIARLPPLVSGPGAWVTARHGRAGAVALLAEVGRLARPALAAKVLAGEVLPVLALLARLRRCSTAEPVGRVLWAALPLVPAARPALGRRPRDRGIVHLAPRPVGERCGG
jgi:hypothetical protein